MKSKFILAASIAMALATSAQATTVVLAGATSFRVAINESLKTLYPNAKIAYVGTSGIDGATQAVFDDSANSGVVILTNFNGSATGIQTIDQNKTIDVIDTTKFSNTGTFTSPLQLTSPATKKNNADAALSDVFQSTTAFNSTLLTDTQVGVMPFVWVTNNIGKNLGITNITSNFANSTLQSGGSPASFLTGNSADAGKAVYVTGRNSGSGTRITALAEINYPTGTDVNQFKPIYTGNTITGVTLLASSDGLSSGGNVATALNSSLNSTITLTVGTHTKTTASSNVVLVSYLAYADATTVSNGSILSYNGTAFTVENIQNGSYTFWGYEHLFTPAAGLTTDKQNVLDGLVSEIPNHFGTGTSTVGIDPSTLTVQRDGDGQFVY